MKWIFVGLLITTLFVPETVFAAKKKNKAQKSQVSQKQTPSVASSHWNEEKCGLQYIGDIEELISLRFKPEEIMGRCFNYIGRFAQKLNDHRAIFSLVTGSTPFALVDFGKEQVKSRTYFGVVKATGTYSYTTVMGSKNTIYYFVNIPASKKREAWDKSIKLEEEKAEEERLTDKRTIVEQEWKRHIEGNAELNATPFVFIDASTGLMWSRNSNIAEKEMEPRDAIKWVKSLTYNGYSDWRLPSKTEFDTFIKNNSQRHKRYTDYLILNDEQFFNLQDRRYLTSSEYGGPDIVWSFYYNKDGWNTNPPLNTDLNKEWNAFGSISRGFVWPVRDMNMIKNEQ